MAKIMDENADGFSNEDDGGNGNHDFAEEILNYAQEQSDKVNIYIQYRIYNNPGIVAGEDIQIENIRFNGSDMPVKKPGKQNMDTGELAKWIREHYALYPMALMIAAATFHSFPYTWVICAAEKLYDSFALSEKESNTYAQEEILHEFGAEIGRGELNTYTGTTPIDIVFWADSEYRKNMLKYVWRQYPQLQDKIISWLRYYVAKRPVSMSTKALEILGFFSCEDYYYFLGNIVGWLDDKDISTDMMVGQIMITLNQRDDYKNNIYNLLRVWSKDGRLHNLLTALFVCTQLEDKEAVLEHIVRGYIQRTLKEIRKGVSFVYQSGLYDFMGVGARTFPFYRALIEELWDEISGSSSWREREDVYVFFLKLFAIDISQSRTENGEEIILVKLCMVKHAISDRLCSLWRMIWQRSYYRELLYCLLAQYDVKTMNSVQIKYSVESFVNKVLGNIYSKEVRRDICYKIHRRAKNV